MKPVFETSDRTVAQLLRGALEAEGIAAIVQGEHLSSLQGETPAGASAEYRVAIVDDEQLPRASLFVRSWAGDTDAASDAEPWTCTRCGETHEPQFRACWRCGSEAD